jgi:hypothetical protein
MCIGVFSVSCSWRPVCILSLTSCVIPTAAYPMVGHCLLCLTSSHKVGCSQSPNLSLMHAKVWSNGLLLFHTLTMWLWMVWTELKGATPDILQRLIPEHARKQNPTLAVWGQPASRHPSDSNLILLSPFSTFSGLIYLRKGTCYMFLFNLFNPSSFLSFSTFPCLIIFLVKGLVLFCSVHNLFSQSPCLFSWSGSFSVS